MRRGCGSNLHPSYFHADLEGIAEITGTYSAWQKEQTIGSRPIYYEFFYSRSRKTCAGATG